MRCRRCDYSLWNLRSRTCPECGLDFKPSEYDFVGNSVQYRCTECGQDYYGTDEKGHLIPPEFNCVTCGARQHMDAMILLPTEGVTEEQTQTDDMPWLDRPGFKSWFKTGWRAAVSPVRLAKTIPEHSSAWPAWKFAILCGLVLAVESVLPFFLFGTAMIVGAPITAPWAYIATFATWLLGVWVGSLLYCAIWGAMIHGILKITGGTSAGIGTTYQGILYTSWVHLPLMAVPVCGLYGLPVSGIWWPISAAFMIAHMQKVGGFRVAIATCLLPGLTALAPFGMMIYGFASAATMATTTPAFMGATTETQTIAFALRGSVGANGAYPAHALGLVESGLAAPVDFVTASSDTTLADVPLGAATLLDVDGMPASEVQALADEQASALPDNVVAHRVGDFVFTYHGVDPTDPNLWTVIMYPDPDTNTIQPYQEIVVGRTDSQIRVYYVQNFANVLQGQNQLRAMAGLPPIPDPSTITHGAPVTGN